MVRPAAPAPRLNGRISAAAARFMLSIAAFASSASSNSTNPKPRFFSAGRRSVSRGGTGAVRAQRRAGNARGAGSRRLRTCCVVLRDLHVEEVAEGDEGGVQNLLGDSLLDAACAPREKRQRGDGGIRHRRTRTDVEDSLLYVRHRPQTRVGDRLGLFVASCQN